MERAVEAIRNGAVDFIPKPFDNAWVLDAVRRGLASRAQLAQNTATEAFVVTHVRARVPSRREHVMGLLHFMAERTLMADCYPADVAFQVRLALDEALTNALRHGNHEDPSRWITVEATVEAERFDVSIEDEGSGYDPRQVPDPTRSEGRYQEGGRGLFLIRCYMDGMELNARGNRIRLWKTVGTGVPAMAGFS